MAGNKTKSKGRNIRNPLEAVTDIGHDVGASLAKDFALDGGKDFLKFLGMDVSSQDATKASEDRSQKSNIESSESIDIVSFQKTTGEKLQQTETRIEAAIDYHRDIVKSGEHATRQEMYAFKTQIEQIKAELISLANSTKALQLEFSSVSVEQTPEKVGTYQANFFEWMLNMIKAARERVETSEAWMSAQKNKSGKKGYWGMFKKHGTSFGLSNERAVATQVG